MATAPSYLQGSDEYTPPKGLTATTTPQGGSAFKDASGNFYLKTGSTGYQLTDITKLPGQLGTQAPAAGQGTNPVVSPAAVPNGTSTPAPQPLTAGGVPYTPMPPQVKSGIESAANSGGAALSGVPTTKSSTPIDFTLHQGETVDQYNTRIAAARQAQGLDTNGNPSSPTPSTGLPNINDFLAGLGTKPTAPDMATTQSNAEQQVGLSGLQQNLQTLQDTQAKLLTDIQQRQAGEASKPGVISAIINGRMQMISAEDKKAMDELAVQVKDATTAVTQANTAVKTIMKNAETDFQNAEKTYNDSFNEAYKMYTAAETQANKAQTTAKANAQVIINSYKGSTAGTKSITDQDRAQWATLETQAGLPSGTIETAVKNEMNITKFTTNSNGTFVSGIDADGNPYVAQVSGAPSGANNPPSKDIDIISSAMDSVVGKDGFISPSDWSAALKEWMAKGYSQASFIKQFQSYANTTDKTNHYVGLK